MATRGVNKAILLGLAGADANSRTFPNGGMVCSCRIATTETWKDKTTGEKRERTDWHNLVFRDKLAEIAAQYVKKGSAIYVEGRMRTRKFTKDNVERYISEVHVDELQLLGGGKGSRHDGPAQGLAGHTDAAGAVGDAYQMEDEDHGAD